MPKPPAHPKYFEGDLQLRDPTEDVLGFVEQEIARAGVTIAKTVEYRNGIDLYLSSQRFLRALGKKLQERFAGVLKTSRRLHTKSRTGRDLYRVTVLFRVLPFRRGDIIKYKEKSWEVQRVGPSVHLKDPRTGEKKIVKAEDLAR